MSGSREHPTAGHIPQTAHQVGMPDTAVHSAGSKSNYTVSRFYLTSSVCYILSAECTTLLQYVWAVYHVHYTNTLCEQFAKCAKYTTCGQFATCATLIHYVWTVCQVCFTNTLCVGSWPSALQQCGK